MIKALIFDVDGTQAETEELHRQCFNKAFVQVGLNWHWDQQIYGKLLTTTGGKERIARYATEIGLTSFQAEAVQDMHRAKNAHYATAVISGALVLRPGVLRLVREAKSGGLKLGIATTSSSSNVTALVSACFPNDFTSIFDVIVCGEDVTNKKPNPEVYKLCLARLEIAAEEAIAFDDSPVGLAAALAAHIPTFVTPSPYTKRDTFVGALKLIPNLQQRLDFFLSAIERAGTAASTKL